MTKPSLEVKTKTITEELRERGLELIRVLDGGENLPRQMTDLMLDVASRKYDNINFISLSVALAQKNLRTGSKYDEGKHLVYGSVNREHPSYNPKTIRMVRLIPCVSEDGSEFGMQDLRTL